MSQENIEVVRRVIDAFNRGAMDAVVDIGRVSPEVTFDASQSLPGFGVYQGIDETREFWEDWFAAFPFHEWEIEIEELTECDDKVLAMTRQKGRGAKDGARGLQFANVFTVRIGQIERVEVFRNQQRALEAAGLSE
jgi:ketosteroid isomerase-like protein